MSLKTFNLEIKVDTHDTLGFMGKDSNIPRTLGFRYVPPHCLKAFHRVRIWIGLGRSWPITVTFHPNNHPSLLRACLRTYKIRDDIIISMY